MKKEIDIAVFTPDVHRMVALELKYPRNGQYPEQMFEACRDIAFLEQLVAGGFNGGMFVMAAEHAPFFRGRESTGIYRYFRMGEPIHGIITKPTGARNEAFEVAGPHFILWQSAGERLQFTCVTIGEDIDV